MANDIGLKLGIEGEAEFRKQITSVAAQIKTLGTEMGAVTAQFARNATSQEALTSKSAVLTRQIEAQKEKLALQQDMLEKATAKFGAADEKTLSWAQTVNKSTEQLYKLENKLQDTNDALDDTEAAFDDAGDSALSFGDVLKANVIGDAIVSGAKALASAIKDMAGDFIDSAASVKAQEAQFEQTFGALGGEAEAAISRVADASGILDTRLKGTGTQIYAFARSAGADTEQGLDIMERALTVAADSAAYYDRSLEETTESLQSFLKGNYANDAALGLSATETTRNAAAMELFGKKFKDLTEIQKQDTLLKMVEDSMELSGAMGQAQREADGWENVQGNLTEAWKQFQAAIGTPVLRELVPLLQEGTDSLQNMTENTDWTAFGEGVSKSFRGVAQLASGIMSAVTSAMQIPAVTTVFENLATVISTLTVTMIAYKTSSAISGVIDKLKAATEGQTIAQAALNAVMKANPFVLVATLIAGVATALVTLYMTNEDFRNKVNAAWKSVKDTISAAVNLIVHFFTVTIPETAQKGIDWLKSIPDQMKEIGQNIISGLIEGINNMLGKAKEAVKNIGSGIVNTLRDKLGIHSPSTVFMTIGEYMMEGLEVGMENNKGSVMQTVEDIANEVSDRFRTLTNAFDTQSDISDLRYQLWEMTVGKGASDIEKYNKKIEMLTDQEADQAGVVEAAKAAYQTMADQYGVNSAEAMSYMKTLLEEQIQYEKLAASIQEVIDKQRELAGAANISGSYADLAGTMRQGRSNLDSSLDRATANMVNGVSTAMSGGSGDLKVEVNVDGASLARATIADFRRVSKANPEAVNDR